MGYVHQHCFEQFVLSKCQDQWVAKYLPEIQVIFKELYNITFTMEMKCKSPRDMKRYTVIMAEMLKSTVESEIESMVICYGKMANLQKSLWRRDIENIIKAHRVSNELFRVRTDLGAS